MEISLAEKKEKFGKDYFVLQDFLLQKKVDLEKIGFQLDIMLFIPREMNITHEDLYILINEGIARALKNPIIRLQKIIYLSIIWSQGHYIIRVNDAWQPFGKYLSMDRPYNTEPQELPVIQNTVSKYDAIIDIADEDQIFSFWILLHDYIEHKNHTFLILGQIPYTMDTETVLRKDIPDNLSVPR